MLIAMLFFLVSMQFSAKWTLRPKQNQVATKKALGHAVLDKKNFWRFWVCLFWCGPASKPLTRERILCPKQLCCRHFLILVKDPNFFFGGGLTLKLVNAWMFGAHLGHQYHNKSEDFVHDTKCRIAHGNLFGSSRAKLCRTPLWHLTVHNKTFTDGGCHSRAWINASWKKDTRTLLEANASEKIVSKHNFFPATKTCAILPDFLPACVFFVWKSRLWSSCANTNISAKVATKFFDSKNTAKNMQVLSCHGRTRLALKSQNMPNFGRRL